MRKIIPHQKNDAMKYRFVKMILFVFLYSTVACAQKVTIIKDSIAYKANQYVLEEIKVNLKGAQAIAIQNQIHDVNGIFNKPKFKKPQDRLSAKRDTLASLIARDELDQANYGFEEYTIFFQNDKMANLSVHLQSFGSPFEAYSFLSFDFSNGRKIDHSYFQNTVKLKAKIQSKLKSEGKEMKVSDADLASFIIRADSNRKITGMAFVIFDTENYRNSGYERFEVDFTKAEVESFLSPQFKNLL